jgi:hypothetical protein
LYVVHLAIAQVNGQRSLPLDARHGRNAYGPRAGMSRSPRAVAIIRRLRLV